MKSPNSLLSDQDMLPALISQLSVKERRRVRKEIETGKSPSNYLPIFDFYSRKQDSEPEEKNLGVNPRYLAKYKYHVGKIVTKALSARIKSPFQSIEEPWKEALIMQGLGYYNKSFKILTEVFQESVSKENFIESEFIFSELLKLEEKDQASLTIKRGLVKVRKELESLRQVRKNYETLSVILKVELARIVENRKVTLAIRINEIDKIVLSTNNVPLFPNSIKCQITKAYILSICEKLRGNILEASRHSQNLIEMFSANPWAQNEFRHIFSILIFQGMAFFADQGSFEDFSRCLDFQRDFAKSDPKAHKWRYLFGLLVGMEYFGKKEMFHEAEIEILNNISWLRQTANELDFINLLIYFAKLKIFHNRYTGLKKILWELNCLPPSRLLPEVRFYAKVYELLVILEDDKLPEIEAQILSLKRFLSKKKLYNMLPQGKLLVSYFASISGENTVEGKTKLIEKTLNQISNLDEGFLLKEKEFFDFEKFLLMKQESLNVNFNQNRA